MNMTFWYLPRSIDTIFLVVYEPYRVLEGLQGVGFQGIFHLFLCMLYFPYSFLYPLLLSNLKDKTKLFLANFGKH